MANSSIWCIDRTLSGAVTLSQSGLGSDGNESISSASPSDCLVSYQDTPLESLTTLQRCSRCILWPQLTRQQDTCWESLAPLSVYSVAIANWAKVGFCSSNSIFNICWYFSSTLKVYIYKWNCFWPHAFEFVYCK